MQKIVLSCLSFTLQTLVIVLQEANSSKKLTEISLAHCNDDLFDDDVNDDQ